MRREVRAFGVAALSIVLSCGDDDGETGTHTATLTAATYNLGLLDSVGYVDQRTPLAIDATTKLDADVLCVQEVWQQAHWDALVAAEASTRPHTLRLPADPGAMGQCSADEFTPVQQCAQATCAGQPPESLVTCVTSNCPTEVGALGSGCITCLLGNTSSGSFDATRAACVGNASAGASGRSYVEGGSYGIGLLSKKPFAATEQRLLNASTVRRGILYARIDDAALGSLHVFCTHLSAIQSGLKYDGSYGDWDGENAKHVEDLIAFVRDKVPANGKVLVLGDLNTSPAAAGISPSVPANYAKFAPAGFADPFLAGPNAACTFCNDNPLVNASDSGAGAMLDHILTRGLDKRVSVTRQLDQRIEIDVPVPGGGSEKRQSALSDHYALRAVVTQ